MMILHKLIRFANKPFLWLIFTSILLAYLCPEIGAKGGILKPEITVKYFAVVIIFFISGISLKSNELLAAACQYRVHIFIQLYSLIFVPLIVQILVQLLGQFYPNPDLLVGFIAVSCMPPPVSSAVLLTKTVGGNEAAAVFNSAFGSFLGIFVTPALLYLFFSNESEVPIWNAIFQLSFTVVLPVVIGQCSRPFLVRYVSKHKKELSMLGSFMLLLIIYTTFCETFSKHDPVFTASTVLVTSVTVIFLQLALLSLSFLCANYLNAYYSSADVVAILYCSTHKSLTLGFPMLKILYGEEPHFILVSFPLLVYHPMQILIGSLLVPVLQKWMQNVKRYKNILYSV
ncbi:sodium/bile acid cotransporter 7-like [Uloborus diversus]|uniref:sodium/bile acid cotransporter 7-like n=1 Tax=Uloborus diversus TaxID=327109 RepID=UPI002409B2C1|nr:sodium/bile acid cotransporter 7-like [Uloborus diversus]